MSVLRSCTLPNAMFIFHQKISQFRKNICNKIGLRLPHLNIWFCMRAHPSLYAATFQQTTLTGPRPSSQLTTLGHEHTTPPPVPINHYLLADWISFVSSLANLLSHFFPFHLLLGLQFFQPRAHILTFSYLCVIFLQTTN